DRPHAAGRFGREARERYAIHRSRSEIYTGSRVGSDQRGGLRQGGRIEHQTSEINRSLMFIERKEVNACEASCSLRSGRIPLFAGHERVHAETVGEAIERRPLRQCGNSRGNESMPVEGV